jgi:CubicO group peptidase (beta-lactamase class C family)
MTSATLLKRTNPEAEGIPSSAVLDFIQAVEQHTHPLDAVQGFMLLRHGNVAAEGWWAPYDPQHPHSLYSLSKSFTSTAIGLAVAEKRLTVDDPVLKFFPDEAPANPSKNLKAMRVRHLLSMNTGHKEDTTQRIFRGPDDNWARAFLSLPIEYQPGTWFVYNTAATYMLSAIITRLTGESLLDYLRPRLLDPLGIENPTWETDPRGVNLGGTGLHIKTEEIARFGQMYLQKGTWQGKRIVPEAWIAEATKATSDNSNTQTNPDWSVGYGYQFWRCQHNAYRGDGAFGQYCIVMPEQEAVLTMISGVQNMQTVLDKVWEHLLPAMQPKALPTDSPSYNQLCDKLAALSLPLVNGQASSPIAEQSFGKTYKLQSNHLNLQSVAIQFGDSGNTLIFRDERGEHWIQIGTSTWLKGITDIRARGEEPITACGAWTADDTYEVRVCCTEDAYCPVFRFHYTSDELQLEVEPNATWDWEPAGVTRITGRVTGQA